jgi:hypothetical protein
MLASHLTSTGTSARPPYMSRALSNSPPGLRHYRTPPPLFLNRERIDRITDRAYIIKTGTESYRFRRTIEKRRGQTPQSNMTTATPLAAGEKLIAPSDPSRPAAPLADSCAL